MIGMPVELRLPSALAGRLGLVTVSPGLLEAIPTDAIARALRCHGNATGARLETRHSYEGRVFRIRTTMGGIATVMWLENEEPPM
jgi:hypothetical protein